MEQLWVDDDLKRKSMLGAVQPIIDGIGDIQNAHLEPLSNRLSVLPGDIRLSGFEQKLSDAWPRCMDRDPAAFRIASSFHRVIRTSAVEHDAELVLIDVGPNLGAVNRSALIASEFVATPLGADLFSIQGMRNLGPTLTRWREEWKKRLNENPVPGLALPDDAMQPVGYIVMQPNLYGGQVTRAYDRWLQEIPFVYQELVLRKTRKKKLAVENDPNCLAVLRHYRSLMPMAQAARKPIFKLSAAEGAIGAHSQAVQQVGKEFRALGKKLLERSAPPA
jgi:cellulose biosynthesis protein BcsQ